MRANDHIDIRAKPAANREDFARGEGVRDRDDEHARDLYSRAFEERFVGGASLQGRNPLVTKLADGVAVLLNDHEINCLLAH